jgi:hypothetical protein
MENVVEFQKRIYRRDLQARPEVFFLFGDNLLEIGMGGQAGQMRGEPNAIGVPTKMTPGGGEGDFFSDDNLAENCAAIDAALEKLPKGARVVIPEDGLGTGLAELPTRAPLTFAHLTKKLAELAVRPASSDFDPAKYTLPAGKVLLMRTCAADMSSRNGFIWPGLGEVAVAPDWKPTKACGNGLHGLLWGEGKGELLAIDSVDAKWLVVEADAADVVDLEGKVKVPRARVVFIGDRASVPTYMALHAPPGKSIVRGTATAGYRGTATAGDSGTATAGYSGTATAGDRGTATAGDRGTATAGDRGTATAGDRGTATAGYRGTATAGDSGTATAGYSGTATAGARGTATAGDRGTATAGYSGTATAGARGTATAGDRGTATAGDRGTATAGDRGTATAGDRGTATAGYSGTATAGELGIIMLRWYDYQSQREGIAIARVGEDGIKAGTKYRLDEQRKFVEVPAEKTEPAAEPAL